MGKKRGQKPRGEREQAGRRGINGGERRGIIKSHLDGGVPCGARNEAGGGEGNRGAM